MRKIRDLLRDYVAPFDAILVSKSHIDAFVNKLDERERPIVEECLAIRKRRSAELFVEHQRLVPCLTMGDDALRRDCYYLECFYWVSSTAQSAIYRQSINDDKVLPVRELALRCLTAAHFNSSDRDTLIFLKSIARRPDEDLNIRWLAYSSIFLVDWDRLRRYPSEEERAAFPGKVDWRVLDRDEINQ